MFPTSARLLCGLTRIITGSGASTLGLRCNSARPLCLSSQRTAQSKNPAENREVVNNEPIKFSTSKASHRTWKVDRSMGAQYQRPMWKVLPVSLALAAFLLWCTLREETDIDAQLEVQLYERLPGLFSEEVDQEQAENQEANKRS